MYRCALGLLGTVPLRAQGTFIRQARGISQNTGAGDGDLEAEYAAARRWASDLQKDTILLSLAQVSYSRSSGAGGQHVNKTNTKATLCWPMDSLLLHVPKILHSQLRSSRFYVASSDILQISAQTSRKQQNNKKECYDKLYKLLLDISKEVIPGETSEAQKQKIEYLRKKEEAGRLKLKKKHSAKKQARSGQGEDY